TAEASVTGRPMIWKQRDAGEGHNIMAYVKGEKYAYTALVATSDSLHKKAYAGINEAGFAIANNLSYNLRQVLDDPGTRNGELMGRALGECGSVVDFIAFLEAWEQPRGVSANFAVMDANGGAAYFEVSDTAYVRFDVPRGGYLYRTNFSLSGKENEGGGHVRYETVGERLKQHGSRKIDAAFFFREGRSFINVLDGGDALRFRHGGLLNQHDFITRDSSVSSVVIEGVAPGEAPSTGMMWCAVGWPPSCYALPVWVAAGEQIAAPVTSEANLLSLELKRSVRAFPWEGGEKYLKVAPLRRILRAVRRAEKTELRAGAALNRRFRESGFCLEDVIEYNAQAQTRFEAFRNQVKKP
ncbi:MAG: hypothetical protein IJ152_06930, partial [Bacteroidales bacterium]|nr:hypothetical protein [Bacteroidales bacterium]